MLTQAQVDEYGQRAIGIDQATWERLVKEIASLDADLFSNLEAVLHRRDELANTSIPKGDGLFVCTPADMGFKDDADQAVLEPGMLCDECGLDTRFGHKVWCTRC